MVLCVGSLSWLRHLDKLLSYPEWNIGKIYLQLCSGESKPLGGKGGNWTSDSITKTLADVHQKTCTRTFIAPLFIIAPNWTLPSCPSAVEGINSSWCTPTVGPCTAGEWALYQHIQWILTKNVEQKKPNTEWYVLCKSIYVKHKAKNKWTYTISNSGYLEV